MSTILKYIQTKIDKSKKVTLHLPDVPTGEVEIVVIRKKEDKQKKELLSLIPKHHNGKVLSSLRREDIYINER